MLDKGIILLVCSLLVENVLSSCEMFREERGNFGFSIARNMKGEVLECQYQRGNEHFHVTVDNPKKNMTTCKSCTCHHAGYMTCCGIGWKAGVIAVPKGCEMKKGQNCTFRFVNASNYHKDCGGTVIIDTQSSVTQSILNTAHTSAVYDHMTLITSLLIGCLTWTSFWKN